MSRYNKAITAVITAVLAALATLPTGDGWTWVPTVVAFLGAIAVYFVPNSTPVAPDA